MIKYFSQNASNILGCVNTMFVGLKLVLLQYWLKLLKKISGEMLGPFDISAYIAGGMYATLGCSTILVFVFASLLFQNTINLPCFTR